MGSSDLGFSKSFHIWGGVLLRNWNTVGCKFYKEFSHYVIVCQTSYIFTFWMNTGFPGGNLAVWTLVWYEYCRTTVSVHVRLSNTVTWCSSAVMLLLRSWHLLQYTARNSSYIDSIFHLCSSIMVGATFLPATNLLLHVYCIYLKHVKASFPPSLGPQGNNQSKTFKQA